MDTQQISQQVTTSTDAQADTQKDGGKHVSKRLQIQMHSMTSTDVRGFQMSKSTIK
jgi:hypothetical protein